MAHTKLNRTAFVFGSLIQGHYGPMVLSSSGAVRVYKNTSEDSYRMTDDVLEFYSSTGAITSRLRWHETAATFLPADRLGHYLLPLVSLDPPAPSQRNARIILNTVPKSGTYLMEAALQRLGYRNLGLHVFSEGVHDNRGVPPSEIHFDPDSRFIPCPARVMAELMAPGEFVVGHIDSPSELNAIREAGVSVIGTIRDLRAVAVSNFRFRRAKVKSGLAADILLQGLDTRTAFLLYLAQAGEIDLPSLMHMTRVIHGDACCLLRFEELVAGRLSERARAGLDAIEPGLAAELEAVLPHTVGKPTSTFSGALSSVEDFAWPEVEAFYEAIGYLEANREAGYEAAPEPSFQAQRDALSA